jgi:MFS family permease
MSSWKRVALAMFAVGWGANQFTSLLVVYRDELGLSTQTRAALFGVYAIGLVPGLLAGGGASDRWGRRAVSTPFVILSPVATTILVVGREEVWGLAAGRFLAGVCSGVVFSVTSAWVAELSAGAADGDGARRAAIALSAGFGAGPLVSGLVAQFAPHPLWAPYVPHLVLSTVAALLVLPAPETVRPGGRAPRAIVRIPDVARSSRFVLTVAPAAPLVFGAAAVSIAFLPGEIGGDDGYAVAFAAVLSGLTLGTGVLVQPLARALDARRPGLAGLAGLAAAAAGTLLGGLALTLDSHAVLLVTGFVSEPPTASVSSRACATPSGWHRPTSAVQPSPSTTCSPTWASPRPTPSEPCPARDWATAARCSSPLQRRSWRQRSSRSRVIGSRPQHRRRPCGADQLRTGQCAVRDRARQGSGVLLALGHVAARPRRNRLAGP